MPNTRTLPAYQRRTDRPSWHPEHCDGSCCWQRDEQRQPSEVDERQPSEPVTLLVRRLVDPLVEAHGFPVTGVYCETVVLPLLGPSSVLVLRRFGAWLAASPDGVQVDLQTLAGDLGLGRGAGRNSPIRRTISRLCQFHMAEWQGEALAVRTAVAPVSERQLARLSPGVVAVHHSMLRCPARR
jgi:hypothetical protein